MDAPEPPAAVLESGVHGHDLTLGSGSVDGVIGTGIFARQKRVFLSVNVQYAIRTTGDFDYRFADDLSWSGGPGFYLAFNQGYTIALQAMVSGEHKDRDIGELWPGFATLNRNDSMQATPHPDPLPIRWGEGIWIAALGQVTKQWEGTKRQKASPSPLRKGRRLG